MTLPLPLLHVITATVETAWPREGCGLIVGGVDANGDARVTSVIPSPNLAEGLDRFEVDPAVRLRVERGLVPQERLIGHFHSHTNGKAVPSATDRGMVFEPELLWIIVGVQDGKAVETRAYQFDVVGKKFNEFEIRSYAD